jgi:hypothetical protein
MDSSFCTGSSERKRSTIFFYERLYSSSGFSLDHSGEKEIQSGMHDRTLLPMKGEQTLRSLICSTNSKLPYELFCAVLGKIDNLVV